MPNRIQSAQDSKERQCIAEAANLMARVLKQFPAGVREDVSVHPFAEATYAFAAEIASNRFEACMVRQTVPQKVR